MAKLNQGRQLFVVDLDYIAPIETIDALREEHIAFLDRYYATGNFIASGPKVPRNGGVILAYAASREALEQILAEDPFYARKVASYRVTLFELRMVAQDT